MTTELIFYLLVLFDCNGEALILNDKTYQHFEVVSCSPYPIEDCPVSDVDFAVILDGQYQGYTSQMFCRETELALRTEPETYWSSGYMELSTWIHKGGFE